MCSQHYGFLEGHFGELVSFGALVILGNKKNRSIEIEIREIFLMVKNDSHIENGAEFPQTDDDRELSRPEQIRFHLYKSTQFKKDLR